MARFMPQQLFNECAISAAKMSAATRRPIEGFAEQLAEGYAKAYGDRQLSEDLGGAAKWIIEFVCREMPLGSLVASLTQLQHSINLFTRDGRKRRRRFFNGTRFNYEPAPLADKAEQCAHDVLSYHELLIAGRLPLAPPDWHL